MSPLHVSLSFELTGVGLIAVAVWALLFTRRQLAVMQESNGRQADSARNQELQLRASVLLTLDQRWESEPLVSMREELQSLVKDVLVESATRWPERSMGDLRRLSAPSFASRLKELGEREPSRYIRLFQICGFFETVGYATKAKYLTLTDVYELFSVSIDTIAVVFRPYIHQLIRDEGADPALYFNLLWLISEVEKRRATSAVP
jgi:hypothetical protein